MRKFKFIIPILLLVFLVLVGAWCGKEELKEEKTGELEEEEEEEISLLYPEIVCPEGFPKDFIYPESTCRDGFCKEADPPYASYECGIMFYSEDKETDVIKWYKARFSDFDDWVFLGEEETDIGTVYIWRNETELTIREQFRLTMLPREGFDKSFTKFSIGYIDNRIDG